MLERRKLTEQDIVNKSGDYKTVFEIITEEETGKRFIHYLGYCYYADSPCEAPYRLVEYCFFYINIYEALYKGLLKAEVDNAESVKQYIKDLCYEDVLESYNNWIGDEDGNTYPPTLLKESEFTDKTPDGIYILED